MAATESLKTMGSMEMVMIVMIISSIGALAVSFVYLVQKKLLTTAIEMHNTLPPKAYVMILISGVAGVLCHIFLYLALSMAHKGGVALIYDSWPIIVVIAAPLLMQKTWKDVSFKEFMAGIIALVGVGFIVFADSNIEFNFNPKAIQDSLDYTVLGGYILAFAGAYMIAMVTVSQGAFSEYFKDLNDDMGATPISQVWGRTTSVILSTILYMFFAPEMTSLHIDWFPIIYIGLFVFVFGGALVTYALLKSSSPMVTIGYYFVPVLAVVWLWLAGESTINAGLFIGGGIILLVNIYLLIAGRKAPMMDDSSANG